MSNYFVNLPIDMYKKILFKLDPQSLINICKTDSYARNVCNDKFYYEYIIKNYDPDLFNLLDWNNVFDNSSMIHDIITDYGKIRNWKGIFESLNEKKILLGRIVTIEETPKIVPQDYNWMIISSDEESEDEWSFTHKKSEDEIFIKNIRIDIYFDDTVSTLLERINNLLQKESIKDDLYRIELLLPGDDPIQIYSSDEPINREIKISWNGDLVYITIYHIIGIVEVNGNSLFDLIKSAKIFFK